MSVDIIIVSLMPMTHNRSAKSLLGLYPVQSLLSVELKPQIEFINNARIFLYNHCNAIIDSLNLRLISFITLSNSGFEM